MRRDPLSRRSFLQGTGVAVALPMLESLQPRTAAAASDGPPSTANGLHLHQYGHDAEILLADGRGTRLQTE